jgi:hypothetical protein
MSWTCENRTWLLPVSTIVSKMLRSIVKTPTNIEA